MNQDQGYSGSQVLLAFMAGAMVGTCVALLTAPQSGSETRGSLRGWARDTGDRATRLPEALQQAYRAATGAAKEAFSDALKESETEDA